MILYHGSDLIVEHPDIFHSGKRLDFGAGFYTTSVKEQAERWARRKALFREKEKGIVSIFEMRPVDDMRLKDFADDLNSWIDFVCACRNGSDVYKSFDLIRGKVADDKVFRVVDMYKRGIWDKDRAIKEIRAYKSYDQIAFISQEAIDTALIFKDSFEVK